MTFLLKFKSNSDFGEQIFHSLNEKEVSIKAKFISFLNQDFK